MSNLTITPNQVANPHLDSQINIISLPEEMILNIFSMLPFREVCFLGMTCRQFKRISEEKILWKKFNQLISPIYQEIDKRSFLKKINMIIKYNPDDLNNFYTAQICLVKLELVSPEAEYSVLLNAGDCYSIRPNFNIYVYEIGMELIKKNLPEKVEDLLDKIKLEKYIYSLSLALLFYYSKQNRMDKAFLILKNLVSRRTREGFKNISFYFQKIFSLKDFSLAFQTLKEYPNLYQNHIFAKILLTHLLEEDVKNEELIRKVFAKFPEINTTNNEIYEFMAFYYSYANNANKALENIRLMDSTTWQKNTFNECKLILHNNQI